MAAYSTGNEQPKEPTAFNIIYIYIRRREGTRREKVKESVTERKLEYLDTSTPKSPQHSISSWPG